MSLTSVQRDVLAVIGSARTPDSYLAGGAATHFAPDSLRYSAELDFFHDAEARVASAFTADAASLAVAGFTVAVEISQPGFIRAVVAGRSGETRVDWGHDSAWRFMPPVRDPLGGFLLHDVDLALNKTLAVAGRDEPRDFVDILYVHERVLPLAGLVWAAVGKDPGFSPLSLLELLRRRGRYQPVEIARLDLAAPFDLVTAKTTWLAALDEAEQFARSRPAADIGCLYYSHRRARFVLPEPDDDLSDVVPHYGRPGGVLIEPTARGLFRPPMSPTRSANRRGRR